MVRPPGFQYPEQQFSRFFGQEGFLKSRFCACAAAPVRAAWHGSRTEGASRQNLRPLMTPMLDTVFCFAEGQAAHLKDEWGLIAVKLPLASRDDLDGDPHFP